MTRLKEGNDDYTLLLDIIMSLSPKEAKRLLTELTPRYTRKGHTHLYNEEGIEDKENGRIRLMPSQYKAIRTKFGETYMKKAFTELTNYIKFLEEHINDNPTYKAKLKKLKQGTHNVILASEDGWVYMKHKNSIVANRPTINVNPYTINDINLAREYLRTVPKSLWANSMDVESLLMKFPQLAEEME